MQPQQYGARSMGQARRHRMVLATMLAVHGVAVIGLLDASRLRGVMVEARPVLLAVVDAPAPPAPTRPLPPPPSLQVPAPPPLEMPLVAPEPSPSPSPPVAQVVVPPPPAAPAVAATPVAAPAPVAPRTLAEADIQFLTPLAPVYSRISFKMRESGRAVVHVFIDEAGLPHDVAIATSTGFARLDDSALTAVRAARFKPCLENGAAVSGWAFIPIEFELPK
jgi:protein TonB